jgi:hypothetical protein
LPLADGDRAANDAAENPWPERLIGGGAWLDRGLEAAHTNGHVTDREACDAYALHKAVARARSQGLL